jgi:hypothetical protein
MGHAEIAVDTLTSGALPWAMPMIATTGKC